MAVYQMSLIFEAETDEKASDLVEYLTKESGAYQEDGLITNAKVAFTKFEKEATDEVSSEE